jgi:GntR family transcriptional repressor for pyruvate dehydrogenase complex
MEFNAINKITASRMVVEQIFEKLKAGEIKPGDKLPSQTELAKLFRVGLSSIREAIKALDAMGYVDIIQGKGTHFKKNISSDNLYLIGLKKALEVVGVNDLMKTREVIECSAAELASKSTDMNKLQRLREAIKILDQAEYGKNFLEADLGFHIALAEASDNILLCEILKLLVEKVHRHHLVYFSISSTLVKKTKDTAKQILDHIIRGQGENAAACVRYHLSVVDDALKDTVSVEMPRKNRNKKNDNQD